ncbi:(3S,6E)-nerolidol synthase 1-like [Magnolia sinica]|uniref:(3S,6E)-nerolidol synthase 1-like n=1 Tax=Magnolia sinica TaxID=86752 RepID=UPI002659376E|nr:(3S,6E)-nerolidol synthase 1-like [Magnolia sinica]
MAFSRGVFSSPHSPIAPITQPSHELRAKKLMIWNVSASHHPIITQDHDLDNFHVKRTEKLEEVRRVLHCLYDPLECMMMIDSLQCLSIDYHFQEEIEEILSHRYKNLGDQASNGRANKGLYNTTLSFRLLRQHGYYVSPDIFDDFRDRQGRFKPHLNKDVRGMLGLYEASRLGIVGEEILDEACDFTRKQLKASMTSMEPGLAVLAGHALEHPIHMSLPRFNTKNYLNNQLGSNGSTGFLHELAKLDFNSVQSLHQRELREFSKWWRDLGLAQELSFARDQPMKWYMWPLAILSNPHFSEYRIELTKPISLIYIIDDIFDVYGTLDELAFFTEAVVRWELSAIDRLPRYMQICFMALYNTTNEISFLVLKKHGWNPIHSLKKTWADLCKAFLVEAKWFASGQMPKADEYLRNGVISTGVHIVLVHAFFLLGHGITRESIERLDSIPGLISCPATILRLWDDLGSAKDENQEGKDGSYVECYMKEHGITSPTIVGEHVMQMISMEWKKLNKELLSSNLFSPSFKEASLNTARMVQIMYSYDQNQRLPALEGHINSLLKEKCPL